MVRAWLLISGFLYAAATPLASDDRLPGTSPLTAEDPFDETALMDRLMDGAHEFVERKIAQSVEARPQLWSRDPSSRDAYDRSVAGNRTRLAHTLGVVDSRTSPELEIYGAADVPVAIAETERFRVYQARWSVLDDVSRVTGDGLLLRPKSTAQGYVIALPDAVWTPEDVAGLTDHIPTESQYARRLAENGFEVLVPTIISRDGDFSGNPRIRQTGKPHREWIYHMAYQMGRHVIGYEVQRVLAAVDWFKAKHGDDARVGIVGRGEGALVAFYAAGLDPRIDATLVSGYFESRQAVWREPIYRNVWGLLREFGDAEIATLVAPRGLVVEHSDATERHGARSKTRPDEIAANEGRLAGGEILTPRFDSVRGEFERIETLLPSSFGKRHLVHGEDGATVPCGSREALRLFAALLGAPSSMELSGSAPVDQRAAWSPSQRQRRQVKELENHVQWLVRNSDHVRDDFFLNQVNHRELEPFVADVNAKQYRRILWEEVLGKIEEPLRPFAVRSRKLYDRPTWEGYAVVLDVLPEVIAYGIIQIPKDIPKGEQRPVVVCQHGRNGRPSHMIEGANHYYHDFATRLVERGFITFAPHNLYRREQRYRWLDRKANNVKLSMFSVILSQHEQILNWLKTLPYVDKDRIGFYGLSYGGETAVRVPPLLDGYCLSICSADFNDWTRRVADSHSRYGYPFHDEWEMPYFNMGQTFNYAELVYLIAPRPFMVERGHRDGVGPDEWVAYEFAKVKRLYDELGIGDRAEAEFFIGGHTINAKGTFEFLHKHLRWPQRK